MKYFFLLVAFLPVIALGCNYIDDPRLSNENMPSLIESIQEGKSVPPVLVRVSTYLQMGERSLELLEPHIQMHDINCSPVAFYEGELLSRAVIPFEEYYRLMAEAIHANRPSLAKNIYSRVSVAPKSVSDIQDLFSKLPYEGSYGVSVREKMYSIFPLYAELPPKDKDLPDPLESGREKDYAMIKLFKVFGGDVLLGRGCGPYELNENFYREAIVNSMFGRRKVYVVRHKPFVNMMKTMGYDVLKEGKITFYVGSC
ncbi:hypothetical protein [Alcanivorax sp.]|jgi:hypothetical protein|uniref:hypothetical protein n=1 Tax=Alcanivorax sp. TaxID=1872427 RepID=UPI0032D91A8B